MGRVSFDLVHLTGGQLTSFEDDGDRDFIYLQSDPLLWPSNAAQVGVAGIWKNSLLARHLLQKLGYWQLKDDVVGMHFPQSIS